METLAAEAMLDRGWPSSAPRKQPTDGPAGTDHDAPDWRPWMDTIIADPERLAGTPAELTTASLTDSLTPLPMAAGFVG